MAGSTTIIVPGTTAPGATVPGNASVGSDSARIGQGMLNGLVARLKALGVPPTSYIMIDTASGEYVTGKSPEEAGKRFQSMHPGAVGWMCMFGDLDGARDAAPPVDEGDGDEPDQPLKPSPHTGRPTNRRAPQRR